MSFTYQGPAFLEFFHDTELVTFDAQVLLSQDMPDIYSLTVPIGQSGWEGATAVRVSMPDGLVRYGVISWRGQSSVVFVTDLPGMDVEV